MTVIWYIDFMRWFCIFECILDVNFYVLKKYFFNTLEKFQPKKY